MRSASNVYYANVQSAIYLPRGDDSRFDKLIELFQRMGISASVNIALNYVNGDAEKVDIGYFRKEYTETLKPYRDEEIRKAVKFIDSGKDSLKVNKSDSDDTSESKETEFRREEYDIFKTQRDDAYLRIRQMDI